ncbi:MAG TPA: HD domain-containing protein [Longimicrobiales bacterium]|nr:HD domain-containing protein [Longimicrobiales bacterium]
MSAALLEAEEGRLPDWAQVDDDRRGHIGRVASLLDEWALALALPDAERRRWRAAAFLHDALRGADPAEIRSLVPFELRDLAPPLLHGPAAAALLRREGVADEPLLLAIGYHTLGHAGFDQCGRALFAADYLEPGRPFDPLARAALRTRMPHGLERVLPTILRSRIVHLLHSGRHVRPETLAFWNALAAQSRA